MRIHAAFSLLLCALALLLTACGDGGSSSSTGAGLSVGDEREGATITKAELIKQADAICTQTDKLQRDALKKSANETPGNLTTKVAGEESLREIALPPIATEIEEIESLGAPRGDEAKIAAITSGLQKALRASIANPSVLLKSEGPFAGPDELAAAYGFKACAEAL